MLKIGSTTIGRIFKSRFKKEASHPLFYERVAICLQCPHNTVNIDKIGWKTKLLKFLSDSLSFVTFNNFKDYGICEQCGCNITYKANSEDEQDDCLLEKWNSIYVPNSTGIKNGKK